jgi:hypothetical protein
VRNGVNGLHIICLDGFGEVVVPDHCLAAVPASPIDILSLPWESAQNPTPKAAALIVLRQTLDFTGRFTSAPWYGGSRKWQARQRNELTPVVIRVRHDLSPRSQVSFSITTIVRIILVLKQTIVCNNTSTFRGICADVSGFHVGNWTINTNKGFALGEERALT